MATALSDIPISALEDELVVLAGQLAAGTCRWLLLLAEFDRRQGWAFAGIRSCAHWLSIRLAISPSTARAHLAVGHALAGLPLMCEEFAAGRLSYSQVRALCREADATNEAELIRLAQNMNAEQLEKVCRALRGLSDDVDAEVEGRTSLVARWDDQGTATIRARIPNDDAAVVMAAVDEQVKKMDLPWSVPLDARRAMALVELIRLGAEAAGPVRDRPLVHITIPLADLEAGKGGSIDGRPIADATVRRMLCDGSVVGVVLDEHGNPVAVGNKARVPSPRTRRCVDVRDGKRCTYPGCTRPSEEIHHVEHWVDTHRTAAEILTSLCGYHHRAHHRGAYNIDSDPQTGQARFTRPDGTPILTRAATAGTPQDIPASFPTDPGTVPSRWDGSPLLLTELTPPRREHADPTTLRFASWRPPDEVVSLLAHTLGCQFTKEGAVWITSSPDLITITPSDEDGTLITVDLTTRPHQLKVTLSTIGLTDITPDPRQAPAPTTADPLPTEAARVAGFQPRARHPLRQGDDEKVRQRSGGAQASSARLPVPAGSVSASPVSRPWLARRRRARCWCPVETAVASSRPPARRRSRHRPPWRSRSGRCWEPTGARGPPR